MKSLFNLKYVLFLVALSISAVNAETISDSDYDSFMTSLLGSHSLTGSQGCENLVVSKIQGGYLSPDSYSLTLSQSSGSDEKVLKYAHLSHPISLSENTFVAKGYDMGWVGPERKIEAKLEKSADGTLEKIAVKIYEEPTFMFNHGFECSKR